MNHLTAICLMLLAAQAGCSSAPLESRPTETSQLNGVKAVNDVILPSTPRVGFRGGDAGGTRTPDLSLSWQPGTSTSNMEISAQRRQSRC